MIAQRGNRLGTGKRKMGPDFNNDGRVDGYDMEYLGGSGFGGCGAGCGEAFKLGCLIPVGLLVAGSVVLTCLFYACTAFYNI